MNSTVTQQDEVLSLRKRFPKEYKTWASIKWRCHCTTARDYHKYGERGITVFEGWRRSFETFLRDVGAAPGKEYSLERINNALPYEPGNIRWATIKEQNKNRRNTLFILHDCETIYFAEFCRRYGLCYNTGRRKLRAGWTAEELINNKRNHVHTTPN